MATLADTVDCGGVAVITGGASGFGLETARRCVAASMDVAILDFNEGAMAAAQAELVALGGGGGVLTLQCDVSSWDSCVSAAEDVAAHFSKPISYLFVRRPPILRTLAFRAHC